MKINAVHDCHPFFFKVANITFSQNQDWRYLFTFSLP